MYEMSMQATIPLLILVGMTSSVLASMIGLGGGITAIPFIMLIIGNHNLQAKLIAYTSITFLSIIASFKYYRQKRKPLWKEAGLILIGVIPVTVISEMYLGPILDTETMKPYFHLFYAIVIIIAVVLVNGKNVLKLKKPINNKLLPPIGAFIGFLSGSFGLSGGVVFVPLLIVGLQLSLKEAAVTSLVLKLAAALANVITGASTGQFADFENNGVYWFLPIVILVGSFIGSQMGPYLNKKITEKQMNILFNVVMGIIFVWEIIRVITGLVGIY